MCLMAFERMSCMQGLLIASALVAEHNQKWILLLQFERTLIVADEDSEVSYLEGCTAPSYDKNQVQSTAGTT